MNISKIKKKKLAIIDADVFVFQSAYSNRDQMNMLGVMAAKSKLDSLVQAVLEKVDCDYYLGFYGQPGTKNYRYDIATLKPYKDSRNKREEPWIDYFKPILKNYMGERWGFIPVSDIEADDAVKEKLEQELYKHVMSHRPYFSNVIAWMPLPEPAHSKNNFGDILLNEDLNDEYLIEQTAIETFDIIDAITPALRDAVKHLLVQQGVRK